MTPHFVNGDGPVSLYSQSNACEQLRVRPSIAQQVDAVDATASAEELVRMGSAAVREAVV